MHKNAAKAFQKFQNKALMCAYAWHDPDEWPDHPRGEPKPPKGMPKNWRDKLGINKASPMTSGEN